MSPCSVSDPAILEGVDAEVSTSELWLQAAEADYRLCRVFADRYGARLPRSLRSQRVGWELFGHRHFALLLPELRSASSLGGQEWLLYYVMGESLFHRTQAERDKVHMIVLAESVDDWAALLRQALHGRIFDLRYEVSPDYVSALGETECLPCSFLFVMEAYAPQAVRTSPLRIAGGGATPEQAAREACRYWLLEQCPDENIRSERSRRPAHER